MARECSGALQAHEMLAPLSARLCLRGPATALCADARQHSVLPRIPVTIVSRSSQWLLHLLLVSLQSMAKRPGRPSAAAKVCRCGTAVHKHKCRSMPGGPVVLPASPVAAAGQDVVGTLACAFLAGSGG